ncbi:hypothetical protein BWD09_11900 [Neisseria dentiae]|uniref:DUF4189 domain-containing protein n=1 Tax=Neisseria dentiae TaxID=194197 RepID=A0A1X3D2B2_9NEIS|nr:DUF4189 domain-containing protein [Neisseria dentiae]OSI13912.1 hypothetical protein BWD09_11900 [Neisseria dentiae]QMT44352.1 DUF4189 domain-containing protein [Neisseria dentiae]STZ50038.1 Uncharacterised protein [Neisseria dentiae]
MKKLLMLILLCMTANYIMANALNNPVTNPCIQRPELSGCGANSLSGDQSVTVVPNRWGAIYYNSMNMAIGYSRNNTKGYRSAEKEALRSCIRAGGGKNPIAPNGEGCHLMTKYRNACGAIAIGRGGGAAARSHKYKEQAEKEALAWCNQVTTDCRVYYSDCSRDPRYVVTD